jgi:BirA family biotin operon repressor/biotin-[acetyl-CoA-carboxylase] ligase
MKLKKFNFKTVNSTNDRAIRIIKKTNIKSGIVIAEKQNKGRGQYGRRWSSYKGNLFVSIFFSMDMINISLKKLTKINCFLVKRLLSSFYKGKIIIREPNDLAIKIIRNTNNKSGIIIAEKQKKGRGQYGKKWTSFKGNLFVSIFFSIDKINLSLSELTKINCLLVKKLLSYFYKGKITIKKPNDLLINQKKISGILQETLSKSGETFIIVGIGINLIKSPNIQNYSTGNLLDTTNVKINSNNAISNLIKIYEKFIPMFPKINVKNINKI